MEFKVTISKKIECILINQPEIYETSLKKRNAEKNKVIVIEDYNGIISLTNFYGNPKKELIKIENMVYVFCAYREWALQLYEKLTKKYEKTILIKNPKKLTSSYIKKINPEYIFFPDWSWIIPNEIVENFKCVCFHESNLPKFRGGSPIQNQIINGIKKTKSTAFLMNNKLDAGDILLKRDLLLSG